MSHVCGGGEIHEAELRPDVDDGTGIDLSLLRENLKLTPWERILANEDTINFIDMAREVMAMNR